jgi:hexosaminidase
MMFPRLTAVAELAWSPQGAHNWMDYTARVLAHERRWNALGINYRRFNSDLTL